MKHVTVAAATLLVALTTLFAACKSEETSQNGFGFEIDTPLKYENGLFYPIKGGRPFSGEVKWQYNNDTLAGVMTYREGHLVQRKRYYRNGQIMNEMEKSADRLIASTSWFPSGQMQSKYDRGSVKQWYENGQLQAVWETDSLGVLQGRAEAWYPDGTPLGVEHYKDGMLDGDRVLFDSTGVVESQGHFSEGEKVESSRD